MYRRKKLSQKLLAIINKFIIFYQEILFTGQDGCKERPGCWGSVGAAPRQSCL